MQYAVIKSGGKQYKISVGDVIELDKLNVDEKSKIVFDDVLLLVNEGKATIGKPSVSGAWVEAKLIENKKGEKIRVTKFKAKSRYRRTIGFRSNLSVVEIEKIAYGANKDDKKTPKTTTKQVKTA